jgi:hypothetical protein|nr:MAG TPA: Protein of unknown function (DUF806) [Caudoviricetes sp.]
MTIHEMLGNALKGLAPAVGRYPLNECPDTYIAWFEVKATPESASNRWIRVRHMMQVDLYSREPLDTLLAATLYALKRAGCVISDWGPETYETETRYRHIQITLRLTTNEQQEVFTHE